MNSLSTNGTVTLRDATQNQWLRFESPREIIQANTLAEIIPALERIESHVNNQNTCAAGFISYEAAPAFDPILRTHPLTDFPYLWFGIYDGPTQIESPLSTLHSPLSTLPPLSWTPNIPRDTYNTAIAKIRDHIARGDTYQVNYTLRLRTPFHTDPYDLFTRLVRAQPNSYAAYVDTGRYILCSASPELFLKRDGSTLTMKPMKGTAPRGRFLKEDRERANWLHHSEKNRAENVMILDMARNDLGRIAQIGSVHVSHLWETERYPTVWQMTSTVNATSDASFTDILRATFPCASITGAPKARTMQIISDLETAPRRAYTGTIGFLAPHNRAQFNVAIRTVIVDIETHTAEYGVGGGIVWDSEAGDEYAETRTKARVLTEPQPEFSLLESLKWTPDQGYWLLEYHMRRLRDSADYFDFAFDETYILKQLEQGVAPLERIGYKVRILVARDGTLTFSAAPLQTQREPVQLALAKTPVQSSDKFLFHKTTQRAVYDAAMSQRGDADDVLLWNERGELTETCAANIVVQFGDELFTPPIESGLLNGTFRAYLLDQHQIRERIIPWQDLTDARALFRINSIRGWQRAELVPLT